MSARKNTGFEAGKRFVHAAVAAAALVALGASTGVASAQGAEAYASGRILVMPRAGLSEQAVGRIMRENGAQPGRRLGKSHLRIVDVPAGSERAVMERLARHPHVKFAELDFKVPAALVTNDPYAASQWHIPNTRAPAAWETSQGMGVTIAVLDGGVLATHVDLKANLLPGYNAYDGSSVTTDINNHGTAVAGTAAAVLNNGVGVSGVAGAAKIKPIRITDYSGTAWYSSIANGIIYAADQGIRVVNCSYVFLWGNSSVQSAGNYLKNKGGLLVVSAGNNGVNENAAATSSMIVVSATDANDQRPSWSSFGSMVSVAAPGVGIWTTASNGAYESASGTSFSAPVVAGVIALMMSTNPSLSSTQIESLLFSSSVDIGAAGRDIYYGYGRVDADAAVRAASGATGVDTQKPSVSVSNPLGGASVAGLVAVDVSAADNVGVTRVELRANGATVASDSVAPYQFSWDSSQVANGSANLTAVAFDAAGNSQTSSSVGITVANNVVADTAAPVLAIVKPADGSSVSGTVQIGLSATDNSGPAGISQRLLINGIVVARGTGGSLSYNWNTRKVARGAHTISAIASDAAGNQTTKSITVNRVK